MSWLIYKHTLILDCPSKGKCYIGQTKHSKNPNYRWNNGKGYLTRNPDSHFALAIKKYGGIEAWHTSWKHEIIERNIPSLELANKKETYWIKYYNSVEQGYNSNYGGDSRLPSKATLIKLSNKSKMMWNNPGYRDKMNKLYSTNEYKTKMSEVHKKYYIEHPESRIKLSSKAKGRKLSDNTKRAISINSSNRIKVNKCGVEKNIKKSKLKKYLNDGWKEGAIIGRIRKKSKKVYCIELKTMYKSVLDAERKLKIKNVLKCCKDWKYTAGKKKYHFCYENEIDKFVNIPQVSFVLRNGMAKKVKCIETGQIFESQGSAAKFVKRDLSTLKEAIIKKNKCSGYHWEYCD